MNTKLMNILSEAEGQYLDDNGMRELAAYSKSLPKRLQAMRTIQRLEDTIVDEVVDQIWKQHPDFERRHKDGRGKTARDITIVLRYCTLAMVRDDEQWLKEKFLYWLRSILHAFQFGKVIDTGYRQLAKRCEAHLSPEHLQLLAPYLRLTHQILTTESHAVLMQQGGRL